MKPVFFLLTTCGISPCLLATVALTVPIEAAAQASDQQDRALQQLSQDQANSSRLAAASQNRAAESARYVPDQISVSTERGEINSVRDDRSNANAVSGEQAVTRRASPPSEFEQFASDIVDAPLRRFGSNLLIPTARDFTAPPTTTVPPDYKINPGDELAVGLTGSIQSSNMLLTVDSNGRIFVPRVGAISVGGVRYGDIQQVIAGQVSRQYRDFRVSVSTARLHGITVYVTGFAQVPGSYSVSSLSTLVNAVLAAGGPSAGGSFRSIQLRRGGQLIADFDLYDLLLKGDKRADAVLENGDVLYIAPVGAQVAVIGSVNNQSIFETRANDTLEDVLLYAGGVNTVADDQRLLLLDPLKPDSGWQELSAQDVRGTVARRAQVIRVLSAIGIARPLMQQPVLVTVNGEVTKPGRYYVQPGTSLGEVMALAGGLTPQSYVFGTVFTRERLRIQQRVSFDRALTDTSVTLTAEALTSALRPSTDAVQRATALNRVISELRQRKPDGRLVLDITPDAAQLPANVTLENNDALYIPPVPVAVGVFGSVPSPANFRFTPGRKIRDYIEQAGGVQKIGDRRHVFVIRANGSVIEQGQGALKADALPGDLIFVPINGSRGETWAKLREVTQGLLTAGLTAATIATVSK
ncbi:polysaccharide export outer membrane protein [Sphingomonas sp. SORGH_AS870]|uniref:SLBB domain-containing protein n=1 Tax=Sphingomonas sp. SORGH_AS_0870 TaxID=3041801 RepID=UPI002858CAC8|nr:SLBB domain-containing protein [Sphingomonas sp. SORGH_AS_0870]MDR6144280.1 polysaccharide export outer membrane protein [Sphingomonas sp. SORGH_AS_0870]